MDLELTNDQELLRDTTARFVETACPVARVRELADGGADAGADYLRQAAELGWFAMLVPEALGGGNVSGHGVLDAVILAEERGRLLQPGPFVPMNVVARTVATDGSDAQRDEVLGGIVAGELRATWAVADPSGDWSPAGGVEATAKGATVVLTGAKALVQDADLADWLLVAAGAGAGVTQVLVRGDAPGLRITPRAGFDPSRRLCDVRFDDVEVPVAWVVGEPGGAAAALDRQLDLAVVLTVAESVGAMDQIFAAVLDYAKVRTAFGRPIGSFQAVKHLLADTSLILEQSKAIAVAAAHALQDERPDAAEVASIAKSFVGDGGIDLVQNCWQVFGGIGYTWEHDLHLYLRRLTADASLYGEPAWHRERVCRIHEL
jgi:alkylation response protein AidB-like acyl-CoA dehydrogenase